MTRRISNALRLVGATVAVAAAIAGFSSTAAVPASPHLAVATSFSAVGQ